MTLDEWAAEQCGLKRLDDGSWVTDRGEWVYDLRFINWTLTDARCREIVREHFKINTVWDVNCWAVMSDELLIYAKGKTIAEAEINCIKAIREAQE